MKNQMAVNPLTQAPVPMTYDAAGNLTGDGGQGFTYDAQGQQVKAKVGNVDHLTQGYDGDGLRVKKTEGGVTTFYLRSSVLGGRVVAEIGGSDGPYSGKLTRGYVYLGGQLLAVQEGREDSAKPDRVLWVHQDPVTKSQRLTDKTGAVVSTIDLDPWGGETARGSSQENQPRRYTTYERDANGGDEAMFRRYESNLARVSQPDAYDGSYDLSDPQSLNRYSYTQNDLTLALVASLLFFSLFERREGNRKKFIIAILVSAKTASQSPRFSTGRLKSQSYHTEMRTTVYLRPRIAFVDLLGASD